jgi:hypothetical protein
MLTTTTALLIGSLAALFTALLQGSAAILEVPDTWLLLGATLAFSLVRRPGRS